MFKTRSTCKLNKAKVALAVFKYSKDLSAHQTFFITFDWDSILCYTEKNQNDLLSDKFCKVQKLKLTVKTELGQILSLVKTSKSGAKNTANSFTFRDAW